MFSHVHPPSLLAALADRAPMLTRARPVDYSRPPSPHYVLRGHLHPLSQLCFSPTRSDLLFSGYTLPLRPRVLSRS